MLLAAALLATQAPSVVQRCGYDIVREYPHDRASFTQGLLFHDGQLYEGTGQYGQSRVARLDLSTGKAVVQSRYPADQFGEGVTRWKDQLISVTWQNGVGHRWRLGDLKKLGTFRYGGEGWGLTTLGDRIVMSDGTSSLRLLDPATMQQTGKIAVTAGGRPLARLNELEAIGGDIWANVWMTDQIVRIQPATGIVTSVVDLSGLRAKAGVSGVDSVLNGIAWDEKGKRLFVTGKYWPKLFEIRVRNCA